MLFSNYLPILIGYNQQVKFFSEITAFSILITDMCIGARAHACTRARTHTHKKSFPLTSSESHWVFAVPEPNK